MNQLIVETTNLCDARCVTCPREKFTQKPHTMDMDLFRKIVDDAAQYVIELPYPDLSQFPVYRGTL
jgi:molybdenum cofactor biosynthesis enzyme MoaA